MARINKIVCDRCGKTENTPEVEGDETDIAQTYVTVARRRAGVPTVLDMCTDCCTFVAEAMKMAVAPVLSAPVNDDAAIKRTPVYGHPTYQTCGCYVTDHLPGQCTARTRVVPPHSVPTCERRGAHTAGMCVSPDACANAGECQARSVREFVRCPNCQRGCTCSEDCNG